MTVHVTHFNAMVPLVYYKQLHSASKSPHNMEIEYITLTQQNDLEFYLFMTYLVSLNNLSSLYNVFSKRY